MTGLFEKQQHIAPLDGQESQRPQATPRSGLMSDQLKLQGSDDQVDMSQSPHLETILGKINSIMTDAPADPSKILKQTEVMGSESNAQTQTLSDENQGFVAREPIDLLAPYSDVLKEVRDYFNDRQSLDPKDRLYKADDPPLSASMGPQLKTSDQLFSDYSSTDYSLSTTDASPLGEIEEQTARETIGSSGEFQSSLTNVPAVAPEVLAPEVNQIEIFRHELMDRMSQLEHVIGHHFRDQKAIAREAAQAAVDLTLQNLTDSDIGKRLDALETELFKLQEQNKQIEAKKELTSAHEPVDKIQAKNQKTLDGVVAQTTEQSELTRKLDVAGKDASGSSQDQVKSHATPPPISSDVAQPVHSDQNDDLAKMGKVARQEVSQPLQTASDEANEPATIDQLREMFKSGADKREFGKGEMEVEQASAEKLEDLDPYFTKSSDLRAQFNSSKILSNDEDLQPVSNRKAIVAMMVVTIALLLSAIGLTFGHKSFDVMSSIKSFLGLNSQVKSNESLKENSQLPGKGELQKEKGAFADNKDIDVTGNISRRRQDLNGKNANRLSDVDRSTAVNLKIDPDSLLPEPGQKLSLPPALIGPYSLRHAAANGDSLAQFEVARRFSLGQGVKKDYEKAVMWFMQAAAQGFAPAQYRLATFYERGRGVTRNLKRAQTWYKRAAELGNVKAMHNLAVVSTALDRNRPDYQTAIYWFKQAANRNLADSQFNLAILYQNGVGVPKNYVESYRWFSLAARHGDLDAGARRDKVEKLLKKRELLMVSNMLQAWKPIELDPKANDTGANNTHITSTMSHAEETLKRSRVLTAQILLRRLGYDIKRADGALNEPTILAIKKFEKDKGLPITGEISDGLLKNLNKSAL